MPAFKWKLISGTFLQLCYRAIQVCSNFENKKATEQYLYVVIFIFYLDGLVIWPRHNFPIIKLDTEYSCIMTPKSRESINLSIKIQENLTLFKQLVWTQVIKSTVSLVLWSMTSQIRLDYMWPLTRKPTLMAFHFHMAFCLQAVCQPFEWLGHLFARNISLFERLREPFVGNINLFERYLLLSD